MRVFMDLEFTGLHHNTSIISLGAVADNGEEFYAEMNDYNDQQVQGQQDTFLQEQVMPKLHWHIDDNEWLNTINRQELRDQLEVWFTKIYEKDGQQVEVWLDCYAYDWILFCGLWDDALKIPASVNYIPRDLATYLEVRGYSPDVGREEFAGVAQDAPNKHNALYDAKVLQLCYGRLIAERQHELQRQIDVGGSVEAKDSIIEERDAQIADLEKKLAAKPKSPRKQAPATEAVEQEAAEEATVTTSPKRTRKKKATPPVEETSKND